VNIGIFVDGYIPIKNGVVTSVVQLKEHLETLGHHVYVFTASAKDAPTLDHVYRFPSIPVSKETEVRLAIVNFKKIYNLAKDLHLDVIHTHSEFSLAYHAKRLAKTLNIPLVHTTHTLWEYYQHYAWKGLFFKWIKMQSIIRNFLKPYRYLIYPSKKALTYYGPLTHPESTYRIIPNGIDANHFISQLLSKDEWVTQRKTYGFQRDDKIMIFVGRIGPEKRVIELITLLIPYFKIDHSLKIIIVGDGSDLETLKQLSLEHGLTNQIIFTGFILWNQVNQYYLISDLFITLSISEVMPMTMIEALLSGLAIACIKDDAYDIMMTHHVNGVTSQVDQEVINQAVGLLLDPEKLQQLKQASLTLSKQFSSLIHGNKVLEYYQFVIEDYKKLTSTQNHKKKY
jgi:glycosyltransferase involved in cell wall biosynthesis